MNEERLSLKELSNEWDKVKSKGWSRKSWLAQVNSLKKELDIQIKTLNLKIIKEVLTKRECEEFEMCIEHKSKLRVYREVKREIGFEEY